MIPLFGLITWAGYGIGSYGWCLVKGYDITLAQWFNPLHPFAWSSNPGMVPAGQVFPGGGGSGGSSGATGGSGSPAAPAGQKSAPTGTTGSRVKPFG